MKVAPNGLVYLLAKFHIFWRHLAISSDLTPFLRHWKRLFITLKPTFFFLTDRTCYPDPSPAYPLPMRCCRPGVSALPQSSPRPALSRRPGATRFPALVLSPPASPTSTCHHPLFDIPHPGDLASRGHRSWPSQQPCRMAPNSTAPPNQRPT
jgi:hypothetical protein